LCTRVCTRVCRYLNRSRCSTLGGLDQCLSGMSRSRAVKSMGSARAQRLTLRRGRLDWSRGCTPVERPSKSSCFLALKRALVWTMAWSLAWALGMIGLHGDRKDVWAACSTDHRGRQGRNRRAGSADRFATYLPIRAPHPSPLPWQGAAPHNETQAADPVYMRPKYRERHKCPWKMLGTCAPATLHMPRAAFPTRWGARP